MTWSGHPDTSTIARAQGEAERSGHERGSPGWLGAYRDAYERAAGGGDPESLAEYLAGLDLRIAEGERAARIADPDRPPG